LTGERNGTSIEPGQPRSLIGEDSDLDERIVVGIVVVALLVLVRHLAARRVAARDGRFVWPMFVPTLIVGVAILYVSIQTLANEPLLGAVMAIGGVIYLAVLVRFLIGLSRSITSAASQDDLATAVTEPMVDYMSTMVGLGLIGGVIAVVVLIVWGVIQAAH
jgi:hypothetical protein